MLYVTLTIKVKVGIPESVKVGWYPHKITGSSHLKDPTTRRRVAVASLDLKVPNDFYQNLAQLFNL